MAVTDTVLRYCLFPCKPKLLALLKPCKNHYEHYFQRQITDEASQSKGHRGVLLQRRYQYCGGRPHGRRSCLDRPKQQTDPHHIHTLQKVKRPPAFPSDEQRSQVCTAERGRCQEDSFFSGTRNCCRSSDDMSVILIMAVAIGTAALLGHLTKSVMIVTTRPARPAGPFQPSDC